MSFFSFIKSENRKAEQVLPRMGEGVSVGEELEKGVVG
jgi:hypothetical protein